MSIQKFFVSDGLRKAEIDEFLAKELSRAGYTKVEVTKTTLGTRLVVYAAKPGMVIGRRGQSIRDLTTLLEQRFHMENPQVSVATIELPELEPKVVAGQLASALERGIHFRRAAYWAMQRVMTAGALGIEISIRGKLSTERGRCEKFRQGYLPKSGDPVLRQVKKAVEWVQLKQGLFGVQIKILPPSAQFPDRPTIKQESEIEAEETHRATVESPQEVEEDAAAPSPEKEEDAAERLDTREADDNADTEKT
jgi:small subunit ribosomal protein S3